MVSDRKIFMGISHRSYVKLSSAVVAILVGDLKCPVIGSHAPCANCAYAIEMVH